MDSATFLMPPTQSLKSQLSCLLPRVCFYCVVESQVRCCILQATPALVNLRGEKHPKILAPLTAGL